MRNNSQNSNKNSPVINIAPKIYIKPKLKLVNDYYQIPVINLPKIKQPASKLAFLDRRLSQPCVMNARKSMCELLVDPVKEIEESPKRR